MVHFPPQTRGKSNGVPQPASRKQSQPNEKRCWWGTFSQISYLPYFKISDPNVLIREALSPETSLEKSPYPLRRKKSLSSCMEMEAGVGWLSYDSWCSVCQCNIILPAGCPDYLTQGWTSTDLSPLALPRPAKLGLWCRVLWWQLCSIQGTCGCQHFLFCHPACSEKTSHKLLQWRFQSKGWYFFQ